MSWFKFSKDYVQSIKDSKPEFVINSQGTPLESQLNQQQSGEDSLSPSQLMNLKPDLMKAGPGQGGGYLNTQHRINMPEGDNFIGENDYH